MDTEDPGAALPPMALLATLQTATTVWEGVSERRAGRDPTAQEPSEGARAYLQAAIDELDRLHMQLLMASVQATRHLDEPPTEERPSDDAPATERAGMPDERTSRPGDASALAATVRRFDMLMKLRRTDRLLHGAHQRLMSLYPAVSEALVEEARQCRGALADLRDARSSTPDEGDFGLHLGEFLHHLLSFTAWVSHEL